MPCVDRPIWGSGQSRKQVASLGTVSPFLVIALCKVMTFLSCRLVVTPTSGRRLFSVFFRNSATKISFHSGAKPLDGVTRRGPPPSSQYATAINAAAFNISSCKREQKCAA